MYRQHRPALCIGALLASVGWTFGHVAAAQAVQPADAATQTTPTSESATAPAAPGILPEIIVTAQRKRENLERVPLSITAFGEEQITKRNIRSESDLQTVTPGLIVRSAETANQLSYSIRGQTIDPFSFSHTAVVPYIDEIEANGAGLSSFYDLSSIQVLKGPQGTLFGRNATGGAVLFETTAPKGNEFGGYITVDGGNYAYAEVKAAANIPIIPDKVLFRLAGDYTRRDGYIYNVYDGSHLGAVDRKSIRGTLLIGPDGPFTNKTVFEYSKAGGNNTGDQIWSVYPCGTPGLNTTEGCLFGPALDKTIGVPGAWAAYLAAHPKADPQGILHVYEEQQRDPYRVNFHEPSFHRAHNWYLANTSTYSVDANLQLKNILGVSYSHSLDSLEINGSPYGIQIWTDPNSGKHGDLNQNFAVSDELQLLGKALGGDLSYVAGGYYSYNDTKTGYFEEFFDLSPVLPPGGNTFNWRNRDYAEAAYFQGTYDLSRLTGLAGLSVIGGFRYTWEQIHLNQLRYSRFVGAAPETLHQKKPSWQVGLQYQVDPALMLYVTHRGSWRAGGINGVVNPVPTLNTVGGNLFLPETTKDVEAGFKYAGRVAGMPARLNMAAYIQWVRNVQRAVVLTDPATGALSSLTANVPEAEIKGIEADLSIHPVPWLELGGQVAYTHAEYTKPTTDNFGVPTTYGPYSATPRWSGSAYAEVDLATPADVGKMSVRADVYAQTPFYFSDLNATVDPGTKLPGYTLVNLRYDWQGVFGSKFTLSAFCKNLLDKVYYTGGYAEGVSFGANGAVIGEPRMFGGEITYKF